MKSKSFKLLLILSGAFAFNILFWQEKMGLNLALFDVFLCASLFSLFPRIWQNNLSKSLLVAQTIALLMVVIQNTLVSKIAFSVTFLLFVSFSEYAHQSVFYAGGSIFLNYFRFIPNFIAVLQTKEKRNLNFWSRVKSVRYFVVPLMLLSVFFIIYSAANTFFSNIALSVYHAILNWVENIFYWFSFERFCFFLLGFFVIGGLVLNNRNSFFSEKDVRSKNDLSRKKNRLQEWRKSSFADLFQLLLGKAATGNLSLKNEYKIGSASLVLLNVLLLVINVLDVKYVWLNYRVKNTALSAYVHQGAGMLILSIVLAMFVLLFFFRGNLNFYERNKWLKYTAYIWILQNAILVLSVFNRDYFYISHLGLAYKRIGLLFFLCMVLAGLITVFVKIYFKKTIYFLLRINAWVAIILLVLASAINWDETIAEYNLARKNTISPDVPFLLSLSDRTLPLLQKNEDIFKDGFAGYYYNGSFHDALDFFNYRKKQFFEKQNKYTWLSWNLADATVEKKLAGTDTPN